MIIQKGDIEAFDIPKNLFLAIGNFDGLHLGHQKIINTCVAIAKKNSFTPAILTFEPHTSSLTSPKNKKQLIYNNEQKIRILKTFGLAYLFVLNFDLKLMKLTHSDFIEKILIKNFRIMGVITGYNFCFGNKKVGDVSSLEAASKKYGFLYYKVEKVIKNNIKVSSSKIREFLSMGMIEITNTLLGRKYAIYGKVIYGRNVARSLGFNTANILLDKQHIYPLNGVYLVKVSIAMENFYGVANIGVRPTISDSKEHLLEVYIFDFNQNIYEKDIKVEFLNFIRPERNLGSIENLKIQVQKDIKDAKYILSNML